MNAAGQRTENAGQRERQHLVKRRVDAHHRRGFFVFADRDQSKTEAAARQPVDRQRREHEQPERQLVKQRIVVERRQDEADILPGDFTLETIAVMTWASASVAIAK